MTNIDNHTHTQTNTQGENIITSLSRVINNHWRANGECHPWWSLLILLSGWVPHHSWLAWRSGVGRLATSFHMYGCDLNINCYDRLQVTPAGAPFYASAFRRRRHYVFDFPSVHSFVRSPKYHLLSTHTWVRWPIRPTVTVLRPVRPFALRWEVTGIFRKTAWKEWPAIWHAD